MGKYKINPLKKTFDLYEAASSGPVVVPEYDTDPVSPDQQTAWILKSITGGAGAGEAVGLLLALTYAGDGAVPTYQLSYRTIEDTTVRVSLS